MYFFKQTEKAKVLQGRTITYLAKNKLFVTNTYLTQILNGEFMDYEEYKNKPQSNTATDLFGSDIVETSSNLPFEI